MVDNLASAVRAGLSLPEALAALATRGPEVLRPPFARFAAEYRSSGRFGACLDRLKDDLADPVGDRIVETLRVAREVGGSDLGRVLRTLATFLREDARARAELETRQGWVVQAARLAVAAPWVVLLLLATQSTTLAAYDSPLGTAILLGGGAVCLVAYRLMLRIGRLPAGRAGAAVSADAGGDAARAGRRDRPGARRDVRAAVPLGAAGRPAGALRPRHPAAVPAAGHRDRAGAAHRRPPGVRPGRRRRRPAGRPVARRPGRGPPSAGRARRPTRTVEDFRVEQVVWGGLGLLGAALLATVGSRRWPASLNVLSAGLLCVAGLIGGVLGRDWWLTQQVQPPRGAAAGRVPGRRRAAGAGGDGGGEPDGGDRPGHPAVRRRAGARAGAALGRARAGVPLVEALQQVADRTSLDALARFIDGLLVAIERGTPLAEVLRAQAADVREAGKRRLLEAGGRKEIAMMVPVVFLVLPVTVLFALFPGLISIVSLAQ